MATYLGEAPTLDALARLKPAEFRAWLAERSHQGMARTSTARAFSSVRSFFRFLDKNKLAHNASIATIQTPKLPRSVPKALSERDMEDVLQAESDQDRAPWIDLRDAAVLILLYGAGLRIGEALALTKAAGRRPAEERPRHALRHRQGQQDKAGAAAAAGAAGTQSLSRCLPVARRGQALRIASSWARAAARSIPPSCRSGCARSAASSASPKA